MSCTDNINSIKNRKTIKVGSVEIGKGFVFMAGPCTVERGKDLSALALALKSAGASILRAGAYKPRTSPYSFQGLGAEGLSIIKAAKEYSGLPAVSEIVDENHLPLYKDIDILQVGARNMQNFELLKALGRQDKPVLLKRGFCATIEELLLSAEYILSGGNKNVILCERGIRSFETATKYTLDISAVPILKSLTDLPVIVDPSHASGKSAIVDSLILAAAAAGADGVIVEADYFPETAVCDSAQEITVEQFSKTVAKTNRVLKALEE